MRSQTACLLGLGLVAGCSAGDYSVSEGFGGGKFGASAESSETGAADETGAGDEGDATSEATSGPTGATGGVTTGDDSGLSTASEPPPPPPGCGDGVVDGGEDCDDGNVKDDDGCRSDCTLAACGDGVVQVGVEGCDDGNLNDADACSNTCQVGGCGDGVVQVGEACDDGNANNLDACLNVCTAAKCGDGVVHGGAEQCDTSGASPQCNADCTISKCGDGVVNAAAGEACDGGSMSAACDADCSAVACGDGTLNPQAGEQCDDGNLGDGDGCTATCKVGPKKCDQGNDPGTGAPWVICSVDANSAWVSSNVQGQYHPVKICEDLGYATVGQWGGTAGAVCGVNQVNTSCMNLGQKIFTEGAWTGMGNCGQDGLGPLVCKWVMWTCIQ